MASSEPPLPPSGGGTIVVADDDRLTRELVAGMLRGRGYDVEAVGDGQAAVERVARGGVHLVLLDVLMPKLGGLEACRLLKGMTSGAFLPVVLVTVKTDTQSRVEGLRIGADDYVCKPFEENELVARVEAMLRIKRLHDHVAVARARLEQLSIHDDLTGLYNYRHLHVRLGEEFKRAERHHESLSCMAIDIDRLQVQNDHGGRAHGDRVIRQVADTIRRGTREEDVVARFGGDEFLVVLPGMHFAGAASAAERIFREVSERPVLSELSRTHPVTVSIGVSLFPSRDVRTKDALLRAADQALNAAKREGGRRVCVQQQHGQLYTPITGDASGRVIAVAASGERPGATEGPGERGASERPGSERRGGG
jgi:two-component system, cell cycle response regulator